MDIEWAKAVCPRCHWLRRDGFLGEEPTGYESRPRIGILVVPLLRREAGGVECPPKETGRRTVRDGVEQDTSRFVLWADRDTRKLDDESPDVCEQGISVNLDGATCERTAWPSHIALRLGSESVEVERMPHLTLTTLVGGDGTQMRMRERSNAGISKLEGNAGQ